MNKSSIRITAINSSFRKTGNTMGVVKQLKEKLHQIASANGVEIRFETIDLCDANIPLCRGCRVCFDKGEKHCPHQDKMHEIAQKMLESDVFILSSPVYVEDVGGTMKNWIDHMAYNCHRPAFAGKMACLVTTSGTGASSHSLKTMDRAINTWGSKVVSKANFKCGALMNDKEISERYGRKLEKVAARIFTEIQRPHFNPSFYSLLAFKIQQDYWNNRGKLADSADYIFWREKGWLDPSMKYYIEYRCSHSKVAAARFTGMILAKLLFN